MYSKQELRWRAGGEWISGLRQKNQITKGELVEQAGLPSIDWLEELEKGSRPVTSRYFKGLARSFSTPSRDFARDSLMYYDVKAYEALFGDLPARNVRAA